MLCVGARLEFCQDRPPGSSLGFVDTRMRDDAQCCTSKLISDGARETISGSPTSTWVGARFPRAQPRRVTPIPAHRVRISFCEPTCDPLVGPHCDAKVEAPKAIALETNIQELHGEFEAAHAKDAPSAAGISEFSIVVNLSLRVPRGGFVSRKERRAVFGRTLTQQTRERSHNIVWIGRPLRDVRLDSAAAEERVRRASSNVRQRKPDVGFTVRLIDCERGIHGLELRPCGDGSLR